jgi:transketolase
MNKNVIETKAQDPKTRWKLESQRNYWSRALLELGLQRQDIVALTADLASSVKTDAFAKKFPERHFNVGIAEANMMSIAAGLATTGKTAFASTFAAFGTGRVYDQIRQSIAYPKLNVKIIATHAGITVGGDGATHQIVEDIALMSALPNMTVIVPADGPETYRAIKEIAQPKNYGPVYLRMGRANVPTITCPDLEECFEVGKAQILQDGDDITLVGTGVMVSRCLLAAEELAKEQISAQVINMCTLKPLDLVTLNKASHKTGGVVTAEEHSIMGGLGSQIAHVLAENAHVPMKALGIPDVFGESGGSDELMQKFGLTVENIIKATHHVLNRKE